MIKVLVIVAATLVALSAAFPHGGARSGYVIVRDSAGNAVGQSYVSSPETGDIKVRQGLIGSGFADQLDAQRYGGGFVLVRRTIAGPHGVTQIRTGNAPDGRYRIQANDVFVPSYVGHLG